MGKPKDTVEIRIFVSPELRNEIKSLAASRGLTITEYFLQLHHSQKSPTQAA